MKVSIKQSDPEFNVLSTIGGSTGFLNLIFSATKKSGNASSAVLNIADSDFSGYTVTLTGKSMTFAGDGRLDSGEIDGMVFKNAQGKVIGSISTKEAGGLNLDVDSAQAVVWSPSAAATLLAEWVVSYDASGVPKPQQIWEMIGVTFEAGSANDTLKGSKRVDFLYGGGGNDKIDGGAGNDYIDGDKTRDLFDDDPAGKDVLKGGDGDDEVHGGGGNDKIYGGKGNDNLNGDALGATGNDKIYGEAGNDLISGGDGDDLIDGGKGQDRIRVIAQQTDDLHIIINLAKQIATGQGNDTLKSIEHAWGSNFHDNVLIGSKGANSLIGGQHVDTIDGGKGNDRLHGGNGDDVVTAGAGNDLIAGGEDNDTLTGSGGKDNFYFAELGTAHMDEITDFSSKDDQIYLSGYAAFGLLTGKVKGEIFKLLGNGGVDGNDRYLYDRDTGILYFDRDGNGSEARQAILQLEEGTKLVAGDLEVRHDINTYSFL